MSCNNAQQVMAQAIAKASLDVLTAVGGSFHLPTLHLYSTNVLVTPQTAIGDMVEPTFTGYAAVASIAFGAAVNAPNGAALSQAPSEQFVCSGGTPTDIIYGWYLTDSGNTSLKLVVPFATPVAVGNIGDAVPVQPELYFSGR